MKKKLSVIGSLLASAILVTILFLFLRGLPAVASPAPIRVDGVADLGGIQLSPGRSTREASPGAVVTYLHSLTNTYLASSVAVTLTSDSSRGWEVQHVPTKALEAGQSETLVVNVRVPTNTGGLPDESVITDVTTITATWKDPVDGSLEAATATNTTSVEKPSYGVRLPLVLHAYSPPILSWDQGGLPGKRVYQIAVCAADPNQLYAGTELGVFRSPNAGASWQATALQGVTVRGLDVAANDCKQVYAATWGEYVQRSTNGGESWSALSDGLPAPYLYTVVVDDEALDTRLYAGTAEDGVHGYSGIRDSWRAIFGDADGLTVARLTLVGSGDLLVATWGDNAYRLNRHGPTWNDILLEVPEDRVFEVVQAGNGHLFAATENHLYHRADETWTQVHNRSAYGVAPDPDRANVVYAATESGAWRSTDGGQTFERFGLDSLVVRDVAPGPAGSKLLHVGTEDGAWRRSRP